MKNVLVNRDIVADAAEFSLNANPAWVVGAGLDGVEGAATLGIGVVVVIL